MKIKLETEQAFRATIKGFHVPLWDIWSHDMTEYIVN